MFTKKTKDNAFTLIEMLIVIVIIGILASALIPRLISVQERARDAKRKVDIDQISKGLLIYKSDISYFPNTAGGTSTSVFESAGTFPLVPTYMTSIPRDPSNVNGWYPGFTIVNYTPLTVVRVYVTGAYYGYMPSNLTANPGKAASMLLVAHTESIGMSNWMYSRASEMGGLVAYVGRPSNNTYYNVTDFYPNILDTAGNPSDISAAADATLPDKQMIKDFAALPLCTSITKAAKNPTYQAYRGSHNGDSPAYIYKSYNLGQCTYNTAFPGTNDAEYRYIYIGQ